MPRLLGLMAGLAKSQHASGGWSVDESAESDAIDVVGTHTTNQVVLALGMQERGGVTTSADVIEKACQYLNDQITARAGGRLDRRVRAGLMAGTGAALVAVNCQLSDPVLRQAIDDCQDRLGERVSAPRFALPSVLSSAILARQTGDDNWLLHHNAIKYWLASVQSPDGTFHSIPQERNDASHGEAWEAAHYCLLLAMQSRKLELLTAKRKTPMMVARNSLGKKSGGAVASGPPGGIPAGAKVITLDGLSGKGSIEDQLKEKLKEMGLPTDNIKIQKSTTIGERPIQGNKDKKEK